MLSPTPQRANVPCNGCSACCKSMVLILPEKGDRIDDYQHVPANLTGPLLEKYGQFRRALAQKPNGDCVYLGEKGCTIYDRAPQMCKQFDCRKWIGRMSNRERLITKRSSEMNRKIVAAALARMHTL
jgi:Fe-S-cluster containining protein